MSNTGRIRGVHFDEGCPRFDEQDLDEALALADAMLLQYLTMVVCSMTWLLQC